NETPFTMQVSDAIVKDTTKVVVVNGEYTTLTPGNVYLNNVSLTSNTDTPDKLISITQDAFPPSQYDVPSALHIPSGLNQDLYLTGDVVNEVGDINIVNNDGSITVSGEVRGEHVNITSAKDFTLNSDDWFHSNRDPRQYITFNNARALVFNAAGSDARISFSNNDGISGPDPAVTAVPGLDAAKTAIANALANQLEASIHTDESRILAQGKIAITARFLNVNGLIQSGVQTVTLHVDGTNFHPGGTTSSLLQANGSPLTGISFGADGVPVKGYFDAEHQAIVVNDIAPDGGNVILAGQLLSTGNGRIRVAHGFTSVDIDNGSKYELILNRIDTTKERTGKITLIDTATLVKSTYEVTATGIHKDSYQGVLQTTPPSKLHPEDGVISRIDYTLQPGTPDVVGFTTMHSLRAGLQYLWTEGQEKVKTVEQYFEKNSFNLFGGSTGLEDWLSGDVAALWTHTDFIDGAPMLESEVLALDNSTNTTGPGGTPATPGYAIGTAWSEKYELRVDNDISAIQNVTKVFDDRVGHTHTGYKYIGPNADLVLPTQDYGDTKLWAPASVTAADADASKSDDIFRATFENYTIKVTQGERGGGWLQTKTYWTDIVQTFGQKDFYTHTLKADYPIAIEFLAGPTSPSVTIHSKGDVLLEGDIKVTNGGAITLASDSGQVTIGDGVAMYGDAPDITAGG
ncbi:MAG TPA: hypothetical protein VEQ67_08020, partial [Mycobacterium sp.]|nr:hypothetical protein [Mycobacterium sp.]